MATQIERARGAQHRREVRNGAVNLDRLVVELRNEFGRRQTLAVGDLVEQRPERGFELDAGRVSVDTDRSIDLTIAFGILARKYPAHPANLPCLLVLGGR